MSKTGITSNILSEQCPKCRTGKMFSHNTYNLKSFAKMHDKCSCCNQKFTLEPSFYQGAMVISYALQVGIFGMVSIAIALIFPAAEVEWYVVAVALFAVILAPVVFRLSRSIWIHMNVKYDEEIRY